MPRVSIKSKLTEYKVQQIIYEYVNDVSNSKKKRRRIDEQYEDLLIIMCTRRGDKLVPRPLDWQNNVLGSFDEAQFMKMFLVSKKQFEFLVNMIRDDANFKTPSYAVQMPVEMQLAIVLYRLGISSENGSVNKIASVFGIGAGGTLGLITDRVFSAILKKKSKYICWPSATERVKLASRTMHELPYCVGYIDCTEIKLAKKPDFNPKIFFSRQQIYSIKVQIVCDYELRIRNAVVGKPGSYHDDEIFKECVLYNDRKRYFTNEQWIAGDSDYSLSDVLITPFRNNETGVDSKTHFEFNQRHNQFRARIDNCFEILKEKFCSLKQIRIRIKDTKSHTLFAKWILVCCILHNMLLKENYIHMPNDDCTTDKEDDQVNQPMLNIESSTTSEQKRAAICNHLFN